MSSSSLRRELHIAGSTIQEIELNDDEIHKLSNQRRYDPCPHEDAGRHECCICFQKKISDFFIRAEIYIAICINQFLKKPCIVEVEVQEDNAYRCTTFQEVRKFVGSLQMSDKEVLKRLQSSGSVLVQLGPPQLKRKILDNTQVNELIDTLQKKLPDLFKKVVEDEFLPIDALVDLDHEEVYVRVAGYFSHTLKQNPNFVTGVDLPARVLSEIVLPRVLALQARAYLDKESRVLVERCPPLATLIYDAIPIFKHVKKNAIQFSDEVFTRYAEDLTQPNGKKFYGWDANRVLYPKSTKAIGMSNLSVLAGPNTQGSVPRMLEFTVSNETYPINEIVVIAETLKETDKSPGDLINYFLRPVGYKEVFSRKDGLIQVTEENNVIQVNEHFSYEVKVMEFEGNMKSLKKPFNALDASDERSATVHLQVMQLATEKTQQLIVHFFRARENEGLVITHPEDFERLYRVGRKALTNNIGIQSSPADLGRPSMMVFAFELMRIFKARSKEIAISNFNDIIHWVIKNIRSHNPAFIHNHTQFLAGVQLAWVLYSHARKSYESTSRLSGSGSKDSKELSGSGHDRIFHMSMGSGDLPKEAGDFSHLPPKPTVVVSSPTHQLFSPSAANSPLGVMRPIYRRRGLSSHTHTQFSPPNLHLLQEEDEKNKNENRHNGQKNSV